MKKKMQLYPMLRDNLDCSQCHTGWASQDSDGNVKSCLEQCRFTTMVDRHLVEYADVWEQLAST